MLWPACTWTLGPRRSGGPPGGRGGKAVPLACTYAASMTPQVFFCGVAGFSVVNWQSSMAFAPFLGSTSASWSPVSQGAGGSYLPLQSLSTCGVAGDVDGARVHVGVAVVAVALGRGPAVAVLVGVRVGHGAALARARAPRAGVEAQSAGALGARRRGSTLPCAGAGGARAGSGARRGAGAGGELVRVPGRRARGQERTEAHERDQVGIDASRHASLRGWEASGRRRRAPIAAGTQPRRWRCPKSRAPPAKWRGKRDPEDTARRDFGNVDRFAARSGLRVSAGARTC